MTRVSVRFALLVVSLLALGACKGKPIEPFDEVPEDLRPPNGPKHTHLRGQVVDMITGAPIQDVIVAADGIESITGEEGYYNLQNLRVGATELSTSRAGYITGNSIIPLNGGDQEFNIRLRPIPPPADLSALR